MISKNSDPELKEAVRTGAASVMGQDIWMEWAGDNCPWQSGDRIGVDHLIGAKQCEYLVGTLMGAEEGAIIVEVVGGQCFHVDLPYVATGLQIQPNLVGSQ